MARRPQQQQLDAFDCSIDMIDAAFSYPHFLDLMGISEASRGKKYSEWTEADRKLWTHKFQEKFAPSLAAGFRYMPSEGCFFVHNHTTGSYLADLGHKAQLYQAYLPDIVGEMVGLRVYARNIQELGWSFTVALYWSNGEIFEGKEDFKILCDIPMVAAQDSSERMRESMKKLGFEVEYYESTDGGEDEFGDFRFYPSSLSYKKNGVAFRILNSVL